VNSWCFHRCFWIGVNFVVVHSRLTVETGLFPLSKKRSTLQAMNKKFPDKYSDLFHFLTIDTTENLCCQFEISTVCITMANQLAFFFAKISDNTDNWSFLISYIFYLKSKLHWWSLFKNKADMKRRIPSVRVYIQHWCIAMWTELKERLYSGVIKFYNAYAILLQCMCCNQIVQCMDALKKWDCSERNMNVLKKIEFIFLWNTSVWCSFAASKNLWQ
jgi:hypothetical protein